MKAHRLFLAIPLPPPIVSAITKFQGVHDVPNVRWSHKENLHITVHFFGAVEDEKIGELVDCLQNTISDIHQFELEMGELQFGPPNKPPRMVWLSFKPSEEFRTLVAAIQAGIRENLGMRSQAHGPTAHVTVARFNDPRAADDIKLEMFKRAQPIVPVDTLILFESDLKKGGPEYTPMQTFTLGDNIA